MSIASKLNNLILLRNEIRDKLVSLGLTNITANLSTCKTVISNINNNTVKTSIANSVRGTFFSGTSEKVYIKPGYGYYSAESLVEVPITNLIANNIKSGVSIGGVVGTLSTVPSLAVIGCSQVKLETGASGIRSYLGEMCVAPNGKRVLVGGGDYYSQDGVSYQAIYSTTSYLGSCAYLDSGLFVAIQVANKWGSSSNTCSGYATSSNGISWTSYSNLPARQWMKIASSGTRLVITGINGSSSSSPGSAYTSTNGTTWESVTATMPWNGYWSCAIPVFNKNTNNWIIVASDPRYGLVSSWSNSSLLITTNGYSSSSYSYYTRFAKSFGSYVVVGMESYSRLVILNGSDSSFYATISLPDSDAGPITMFMSGSYYYIFGSNGVLYRSSSLNGTYAPYITTSLNVLQAEYGNGILSIATPSMIYYISI